MATPKKPKRAVDEPAIVDLFAPLTNQLDRFEQSLAELRAQTRDILARVDRYNALHDLAIATSNSVVRIERAMPSVIPKNDINEPYVWPPNVLEEFARQVYGHRPGTVDFTIHPGGDPRPSFYIRDPRDYRYIVRSPNAFNELGLSIKAGCQRWPREPMSATAFCEAFTHYKSKGGSPRGWYFQFELLRRLHTEARIRGWTIEVVPQHLWLMGTDR